MSALTDRELVRDQWIYRRMKRLLTPDEKHRLFSRKADYPTYQRVLLELARRYRIRIPEA